MLHLEIFQQTWTSKNILPSPRYVVEFEVFQLHHHPITVDTAGNPNQPRSSAHKTYTSFKPFLHQQAGPNRLLITSRDQEETSALRAPTAPKKIPNTTSANMPYDDSDSASSVGSIVEDASEPDTTTFKCLFCDQEWARVPEMGAHCKSEHGFDLSEAVKSLGSSLSFTLCLFWSLD
jgi:hypothetical protein